MPKNETIGQFEQHVLSALLHLRNNAYGVNIRREISERTNRNVSLGAVYATLDRLEGKGFVSSWKGEPTPERGGRAKKYFKISAPGERALRHSHETSDRMREGLRPAPGVAFAQ